MATTTTATEAIAGMSEKKSNRDLVQAKLAKRHRSETTFRAVGLGAILIGIALVFVLFGSILYKGVPAFWQATLHLEINFDPEVIDIDPRPVQQPGQSAAEHLDNVNAWIRGLRRARFDRLVQSAIAAEIPAAGDPSETRNVYGLVNANARYELAALVEADPSIIGTTVPVALVANENVDTWLKGNIDRDLPQRMQQLSPEQQEWADVLYDRGVIEMNFASSIFTNVDSRSSGSTAGLLGAMVGSVMMMLIVMTVAVPVGVMAAIYLEEFAPKNRLTDLIEVNINNLAAVPSIVFGLLGAAVFINFLGLPLSAPLVGGLVLSLMTLPTVIIASRAALRAVPPSIRQAALGIGASPTQAMFHHTLPLAVPGMLTGAIIGVAQALGETAPLLLIGMNAFVASVPSTPLDQASALPVQIYLWQGNENRNFFESRTAAAILVLLGVMITLNALAILMRHRFERRW